MSNSHSNRSFPFPLVFNPPITPRQYRQPHDGTRYPAHDPQEVEQADELVRDEVDPGGGGGESHEGEGYADGEGRGGGALGGEPEEGEAAGGGDAEEEGEEGEGGGVVREGEVEGEPEGEAHQADNEERLAVDVVDGEADCAQPQNVERELQCGQNLGGDCKVIGAKALWGRGDEM